jgi:SAM-dependent methyltransferase
MGQERIWEYFQNEGVASFADAVPRYEFLARRLSAALPRGAKVLNIGAGSGQLERMLQHRAFAVSALDPGEAVIRRLASDGVDGRVGSAERLPFASGSFDAVVASEVLEHLDPAQCELAVAEIQRVLKDGGLFLGTVPFNEQLEGSRTVCPECGHQFHRWGHRQAFDRAGLERLLGSRFSVRSLSTRTFVAWRGGVRRLLKSLAKWVLARAGEPIADPHLYFECRTRGQP